MTTEQMALVKAESAVGLARIRLTKETLAVEREQRALLGQYVKQCMVDGTDFGVIPGTAKPTLLKPGAEKLVDLFHCTPCFDLLSGREDFETGFFKYTFRVRLTQRESGAVLAEGFGSANSREARYRWRDSKRKCPNCSAETLFKSKDKPEWFCWSKKGGCGKTYPENTAAITSQPLGRVENPDIADLDNTILKMAKKRALVDGSIALARCSDMFTQDVEDFAQEPVSAPEPKAPRPAKVVEHHAPEAPQDDAAIEAQFMAATAQVTGAPPPADTHVSFGPAKGKAIRDISDPELTSTLALGESKLLEQPKAKWARAMRVNWAALDAERARRLSFKPDSEINETEPTEEEKATILASEQ
jgi:hypothetical protein